jgi:TPR repeat protein
VQKTGCLKFILYYKVFFIVSCFLVFGLYTCFVREDVAPDELNKYCYNQETRSYEGCKEVATILAKSGNVDGQLVLGQVYYNGINLSRKRNFKRAYYWFKKAEEAGCPRATFFLGYFYERGIVVKKDILKGLKYYTKAAQAGDTDAMIRIGDLYTKFGEDKIDPNLDKAMSWWNKAAEYGNGFGYTKISDIYITYKYAPKDYAKSMEYRKKAVEMGSAYAMCAMGLMYQYGEGGVKQDINEAAEWYYKAIMESNTTNLDAIAYYAVLLLDCFPKIDHKKEGFKYLQRAAALGNKYAQEVMSNIYAAGIILEEGTLIDKDEKQEAFWKDMAKKNPDSDMQN